MCPSESPILVWHNSHLSISRWAGLRSDHARPWIWLRCATLDASHSCASASCFCHSAHPWDLHSWVPIRPRYGVVARIQRGERVTSERRCRGTVYVGCGKFNLVESLSDDIGVACVPQCVRVTVHPKLFLFGIAKKGRCGSLWGSNRSATLASQHQQTWQTKTPFPQHPAVKPQIYLSESLL